MDMFAWCYGLGRKANDLIEFAYSIPHGNLCESHLVAGGDIRERCQPKIDKEFACLRRLEYYSYIVRTT